MMYYKGYSGYSDPEGASEGRGEGRHLSDVKLNTRGERFLRIKLVEPVHLV